jgi:polysaccharide pyruvyl transferase WcaK-like protein
MPLALAAVASDRTPAAVIASLYATSTQQRERALLGRLDELDVALDVAEHQGYLHLKRQCDALIAAGVDLASDAGQVTVTRLLRLAQAGLARAVAEQASMPAAAGRTLRAVTR